MLGMGVFWPSCFRSGSFCALCLHLPARGNYPAPQKKVFHSALQLLEFGGVYFRPGYDNYRIPVGQIFGYQAEDLFRPATDPVPFNSVAGCSPRTKTNFTGAFLIG